MNTALQNTSGRQGWRALLAWLTRKFDALLDRIEETHYKPIGDDEYVQSHYLRLSTWRAIAYFGSYGGIVFLVYQGLKSLF